MMLIWVGHGRIFAHHIHAGNATFENDIHDFNHGEAALGFKRASPKIFHLGTDIWIFHRTVIGEKHRDQACIGGTLHIVLATQRVKPGSRTSDLASNQSQCNQASGIICTMGVLGNAHPPKDDGTLGRGIGSCHIAQQISFNAANFTHSLG